MPGQRPLRDRQRRLQGEDRMTVCTMFVADAKASGTRFFTEGNVSNCINKTKSVYAKTAPITPTDMNDVGDACNYVFQGKAKLTEACAVKWDCADKSHICDKTFCAPKVTKNSGDLCGNPGEICNTRIVLHDERRHVHVHGPGGQRHALQRQHAALPREPALCRRHLRRSCRVSRKLLLQRRLCLDRALLRSLRGEQVRSRPLVRCRRAGVQ